VKDQGRIPGRGSGPAPVPLPGQAAEAAAGPAASSAGSGGPTAAEPAGVDLARVALRAAKKQARRGGLRSGARADGRDPLPLGAAISRLITERGWEAPAAVGGVMGRWPQLVGPEVALHCSPDRYDEDERILTVQCDSTAWATQLRLLAPTLVARLNADLGHGTVKVIKVLGPAAPSRSYGRLRAPGSRGPGDTYG
jgi:predicted nucleic acid-binding Zn ribbon protein